MALKMDENLDITGYLWSLEDFMSSNPYKEIYLSRDLESKAIVLCDSTFPDTRMSFNLL